MTIHVDVDRLETKIDQMHQLANRMAVCTDELCEIESAVARITAIQGCAITMKLRIADLTDETRTLRDSADALKEIVAMYRNSEQSVMSDMYETAVPGAGNMQAGWMKGIDPEIAAEFW